MLITSMHMNKGSEEINLALWTKFKDLQLARCCLLESYSFSVLVISPRSAHA